MGCEGYQLLWTAVQFPMANQREYCKFYLVLSKGVILHSTLGVGRKVDTECERPYTQGKRVVIHGGFRNQESIRTRNKDKRKEDKIVVEILHQS